MKRNVYPLHVKDFVELVDRLTSFDLADKRRAIGGFEVVGARRFSEIRRANIPADAATTFRMEARRVNRRVRLLGVLDVGHKNAVRTGVECRSDNRCHPALGTTRMNDCAGVSLSARI